MREIHSGDWVPRVVEDDGIGRMRIRGKRKEMICLVVVVVVEKTKKSDESEFAGVAAKIARPLPSPA